MLCFSVNTICGNVGAVDYTAGYAQDASQHVGMAANTEVPADMRSTGLKILNRASPLAKSVWAFQPLLGAELSQVAVVTRDSRLTLEVRLFGIETITPQHGPEASMA